MSEKLFEANDFISVDINSIFNRASSGISAGTTPTEGPLKALSKASTTEDWLAWGELLNKRLEANSKLSTADKAPETEIESKFFKEFFNINWGVGIGKKLELLGDNLEKVIKILKFNPEKNPILGFITKDFGIKLIENDSLNINTFKALYNAVAKRLVADSEFIRGKRANGEYNLIYCPALYKKTAKEMLDYLALQSKILTVSADSGYSPEKQNENKKVFLNTKQIEETDPIKRTQLIKSKSVEDLQISDASNEAITLNSLEMAKVISGKVTAESEKLSLDSTEQNKVIAQVKGKPEKIFAVLLHLVQNAGSSSAKKALDKIEAHTEDKLKAVVWLATNNIMPKGQLKESDADLLVKSLMATLQEKPTE